MDVTPEFFGLVFASGGAAPSQVRASGFQGVSEIQRQVGDAQGWDQNQMRLGFVQTEDQQHNEYCNASEQPRVGFSQMVKKIAEHVPSLGLICFEKVAWRFARIDGKAKTAFVENTARY
jgi:hypothetical protein